VVGVFRRGVDQVAQGVDGGAVEAVLMQACQHVQPRQVEAADHGFRHVGHRQQLGQRCDLLGAQAVRIAAAIQPFVVLQHGGAPAPGNP
jgi:hypothetical protein